MDFRYFSGQLTFMKLSDHRVRWGAAPMGIPLATTCGILTLELVEHIVFLIGPQMGLHFLTEIKMDTNFTTVGVLPISLFCILNFLLDAI